MTRQEIENKVCEMIKKNCQFNSENIALDSDLRDNYGIDSIVLVELLVEIEAEFGITIDSSMLTYDSFSTTGTIVDYVYNQLNP